jgi:hypothetical protein
VAELVTLQWDAIDFPHGRMHVSRVKGSTPGVRPLSGKELCALRRLKRESMEPPFVFVSERGSPFTTAGYCKMIARLGEAAGGAIHREHGPPIAVLITSNADFDLNLALSHVSALSAAEDVTLVVSAIPPFGAVLGAPPLYSITSSARSSSDGGMARPSALAVLRFTTISNFVGNCTGRSPRAAQNAIHVGGGATKEVYPVGSIGEQAAVSGELRNPINRRYVVSGRPNMIGALGPGPPRSRS